MLVTYISLKIVNIKAFFTFICFVFVFMMNFAQQFVIQ